MRWFEIASGVRLPVHSEEDELLRRTTKKAVPKEEMDEREAQLAHELVSRGVLKHIQKDGQVHYVPNSARDIWRDR